MKIIVIGSVIFSKSIIEYLMRRKIKINGIIGRKSSSFNSDYFDIVNYFKKKDIKSVYTNDINGKKIYSWITKIKPDLIICLGWSKLLKKKILNIPKIGTIGYHPSDLPKNKGRHPIIWSIFLGLNKIASTFFQMNTKADDGKIISKKYLNIKGKIALEVYNNLIKIAGPQLFNILKNIEKKDKFIFQKQKKRNSNFWRKRNFNDGKIDWRMDASKILFLINSLSYPYPGAHFEYKGQIIKVWKAKMIKKEEKNFEPGKILNSSRSYPTIKCGKNSLKLLEFKPKILLKKNTYL